MIVKQVSSVCSVPEPTRRCRKNKPATTSPQQQVRDNQTTLSVLKQIEEIYGIEWPANDESPKNVYAKFITPLHGKWNEMLRNKSIGGGEGHSANLPFQTEKYIEVVQDAVRYKEEQGITENVKVCETGYNMGHSALTYLFGAEGLSEEIKV